MKAIEAILRGLGELRDPRFWGVAAKTIGATLALLIAAFWLAGWLFGVGGDAAFTLPWIGAITVDGGVSLGLWIVLAIIGSAFLATPVAGLVVGLFLEEIVASVERRRYPGLPPATPAPLLQQIRAGVVLAATVLVANALAQIHLHPMVVETLCHLRKQLHLGTDLVEIDLPVDQVGSLHRAPSSIAVDQFRWRQKELEHEARAPVHGQQEPSRRRKLDAVAVEPEFAVALQPSIVEQGERGFAADKRQAEMDLARPHRKCLGAPPAAAAEIHEALFWPPAEMADEG